MPRRTVARLPSFALALVALVSVALAACGDDAPPPPIDAGPADAAMDANVADLGMPDLATCEDADGDGHASAVCGGDDCDDADATRHPGATELCDGDDEDCDDATLGTDADGDGYVSSACCDGARCGDDCDDTLDTVGPRAAEVCNGGVDDDCDGAADAMDGVCVPCAAGYTGFDGDCVDVDECASAGFCGAGATGCANLPGTFACSCGPGFATARPEGALCANVDECAGAENPCGAGRCSDVAGAYTCTCDAGYREQLAPALTCVDIDECAELTDRCTAAPAATCMNTAGDYACLCPRGYEGRGRGPGGCVDVDECSSNTDDCDDAPDACRNTIGSFTCACPAGSVGDGRGPGSCRLVDPSLSAIELGAGARLSPVFSGATTAYTLALPQGAATTTFAPVVADPTGATIVVDGVVVASGASVTVAAGTDAAPRIVTLVVTTETGATRTYVLRVQRGCAYVKASNTGENDGFGAVALSADGSTLAVGAPREQSRAVGVGGDQTNDEFVSAGAVYVYRRTADRGWAQEAYIKASNTGEFDFFGGPVALSADGTTLAVGASGDDSRATGVGGDETNDGASDAGAVYVFRRSAAGAWAQEAYVKASNTGAEDFFAAVALSADGATLAVGAFREDSAATGVGGDPINDASRDAGAVYVFRRSAAGAWAQEAYVKASNTGAFDRFGESLALSGDGATLAVGASGESSNATGVGGDETSDAVFDAGAVYVFRRSAAGSWAQEAYVKASNTSQADGDRFFVVALSADGATLAVGAPDEDSSATGVGGDETIDAAGGSGAVYVFRRRAGVWAQEAYVKASNTGAFDGFGESLALSADGAALAVGARGEDSDAIYTGGDETNDVAEESGAVYVFRRSAAGAWAQDAYVKASNTGGGAAGLPGDLFGSSIALSGDGMTLAVGAPYEDSSATGVGGDQNDEGARNSGAVYVY